MIGIGDGGRRFRGGDRGFGEYVACVDVEAVGCKSARSSSVTSGLGSLVDISSL
jgi:hypothetical protein